MTTPPVPDDHRPATSADRPPGPMTLRSAEDVIAAIRVVLGFEPEESVVLLTIGGRYPLQARVDLPGRCSGDELADELDQLEAQLLQAMRRNGARRALLVAYTERARFARRCLRGLAHRLTRAGTDVVDAMRVDGRRWYPLDHDRADLKQTGVPYDVDNHPFVVAAVVEGRVVHGSRSDLAASLRTDPRMVLDIEAVLPQPPASAAWVRAQADRSAETGASPSAADAARVLVSVGVPAVREGVWTAAERPGASAAVRFWADLVRRAPDDLVADAAALLAFHCWLSGDGAQAWCAVDRALEADPAQGLAILVGDMLATAFAPHEWESTREILGFAS